MIKSILEADYFEPDLEPEIEQAGEELLKLLTDQDEIHEEYLKIREMTRGNI